MAPEGEGGYQPKDALSEGINGALILGGVGVFGAAFQNALQVRNVGAWAVFTRSGGLIGTCAATGGVFQFTRYATANLREKDDSFNIALSGFLSGGVLGLRSGRTASVVGMGALVATVLTVYDYTGASLSGFKKDREMDEFERKEQLRKNRRRPIEETIAEVGEGRSIRPPGYEERRRQRIKEKYGFEVNPVSADPDA